MHSSINFSKIRGKLEKLYPYSQYEYGQMKKISNINMMLLTVIVMELLTGMEFDLFVPSFPELQTQFGLSSFWVEASLSINAIGYALGLFFVGGLGDRYGRKPVILTGLTTFIMGSLLAIYTTTYPLLLAGRFLQGIGIAAPAALSFLIIADHYPVKTQQFFMATLNGAVNLAIGIAPVLGSYLTLYLTWRGNFIALLALAIAAFSMALFFIPLYTPPAHHHASSSHVNQYGIIFRSSPLLLLITSLVILFMPYWVFVGMSPLLYVKALGVPLAEFGYYQGILAFAFALGSIGYGFFIKNREFDQEKMLFFSIIMLIFSLIFVIWLTLIDSASPLLITLSMLLFTVAQVVPNTLLWPICINFKPNLKGRVSALVHEGRLIISAISLQIAGYCYRESFQNIGIIVNIFIMLSILTLWVVMSQKLRVTEEPSVQPVN
jgi:DHA1 family bicyclomycin/chloramphenicol resistance-like MFS transporter